MATSDLKTAFSGVDIALLVGARPRSKVSFVYVKFCVLVSLKHTQGMERADLLKANVNIFKEQGQALNQYASRDVKVCVAFPYSTDNFVNKFFAIVLVCLGVRCR